MHTGLRSNCLRRHSGVVYVSIHITPRRIYVLLVFTLIEESADPLHVAGRSRRCRERVVGSDRSVALE